MGHLVDVLGQLAQLSITLGTILKAVVVALGGVVISNKVSASIASRK